MLFNSCLTEIFIVHVSNVYTFLPLCRNKKIFKLWVRIKETACSEGNFRLKTFLKSLKNTFWLFFISKLLTEFNLCSCFLHCGTTLSINTTSEKMINFSLHFLVYLCKTLETKSELLCSLQFGQRGSKALEYVFFVLQWASAKKKICLFLCISNLLSSQSLIPLSCIEQPH